MYQILTGVTSDGGMPSPYLVTYHCCNLIVYAAAVQLFETVLHFLYFIHRKSCSKNSIQKYFFIII